MKPNTNCVRTFPRNALPTVATLIATSFPSLGADPIKAGWKTYRDSEHGFVLAYPPDFKLYSDSQAAQRS